MIINKSYHGNKIKQKLLTSMVGCAMIMRKKAYILAFSYIDAQYDFPLTLKMLWPQKRCVDVIQ